MFNWIVSDTWQYLEPMNFDLYKILELLYHLTVCVYKMGLQIMYLIYMYKKDLLLNTQQYAIKPKQINQQKKRREEKFSQIVNIHKFMHCFSLFVCLFTVLFCFCF